MASGKSSNFRFLFSVCVFSESCEIINSSSSYSQVGEKRAYLCRYLPFFKHIELLSLYRKFHEKFAFNSVVIKVKSQGRFFGCIDIKIQLGTCNCFIQITNDVSKIYESIFYVHVELELPKVVTIYHVL